MSKKAVERVLREAADVHSDIKYCRENMIAGNSVLCEKLDKYEKVKQAIDRLPYRQKVIIFEFYIKGRSWASISVQIGKTDSHCRALRDLAIPVLEKTFEEYGII